MANLNTCRKSDTSRSTSQIKHLRLGPVRIRHLRPALGPSGKFKHVGFWTNTLTAGKLLSSWFVPEHVKSREGLLSSLLSSDFQSHTGWNSQPYSFVLYLSQCMTSWLIFLLWYLCDIHYNLSWSELNSKQIPSLLPQLRRWWNTIVTHIGLKGWLVACAHCSSSMDVDSLWSGRWLDTNTISTAVYYDYINHVTNWQEPDSRLDRFRHKPTWQQLACRDCISLLRVMSPSRSCDVNIIVESKLSNPILSSAHTRILRVWTSSSPPSLHCEWVQPWTLGNQVGTWWCKYTSPPTSNRDNDHRSNHLAAPSTIFTSFRIHIFHNLGNYRVQTMPDCCRIVCALGRLW